MIKFKVIKSYPNSPYSVGEIIEFLAQSEEEMSTEERQTYVMFNSYPQYFERLGKIFFVIMENGYSILKGSGGKKEEDPNYAYFENKDERDMFYAKNKKLFSYEDVAKLPLEASQLEFFMQTIKKLVNEDKSTN